MRIGFGVTRLVNASAVHDGIDHYVQELYQCLSVDSRVPVAFKPVVLSVLHDTAVHRLPRYPLVGALGALGASFLNDRVLSRTIDLFHAPDHMIPKLREIPVIATLHDAVPLSHPEWARGSMRGIKNWLWRKSASWAQHVITISDYSRQEIVQHFGVPESRISIVPHGVDARYFSRLDGQDSEAVIDRLSIPEQFFLFIGTLQPRKNVERIVEAHDALPLSIRKEFPLLIVGSSGWGCEALMARLRASLVGSSVRWLQGVDDYAKRVLMQRATALVFPSLCEGFGLPILEAFASQAPVITSTVSSLPEVADDAAILVNPYDAGAIMDAMALLARDERLRRDLVDKGFARAQRFTWERCAAMTVAVYDEVLKSCS